MVPRKTKAEHHCIREMKKKIQNMGKEVEAVKLKSREMEQRFKELEERVRSGLKNAGSVPIEAGEFKSSK